MHNTFPSATRTGTSRFIAAVLAFVLVCGGTLAPTTAVADVRRADVVYGQTVDSRGLSVAQCPNIDAEYALVMDSEGTVYFERNASSPTQIASITKVTTAVVALDAVRDGVVTLDTPVRVSAAAAAVGESSADLREGDTMSLQTALKALLVPSGNDAAIAIAETVGAALSENPVDADGARSTFVAKMNDTASDLGCTDTLYENSHGLDFGEYAGAMHSTAADVAKVVGYAMKNDTFRSIVAGGDTAIVVDRADGTKGTIELETTDDFPDVYEYAIGVKTGFTELAGPSFAAAADNGENELYAIVLDSSSEMQRFEDAKELCTWTYDHLVSYPLANSSQTATMDGEEVPVVAEVAHDDWIDKTVEATISDPNAAVVIFDLNGNVSQSVEFNEIGGNVKTGDKVGTITFKQRNEIIATADLVACEDVDAPGFLDGIGIWWDRLFRGLSGQQQVAQSTIVNRTPLVNDKTAASV